MREVKPEIKQENLKDAKAPAPSQEKSNEGQKSNAENPKVNPEPEKAKQETPPKIENAAKPEPDLKSAQAPRDFYKTGEGNNIPGEVPKDSATADPKGSQAGAGNKTEHLGSSPKPSRDEKMNDGERTRETDQSFFKGKPDKSRVSEEKTGGEKTEDRKAEQTNSEKSRTPDRDNKSSSDRLSADRSPGHPSERVEAKSPDQKQTTERTEAKIPEQKPPQDLAEKNVKAAPKPSEQRASDPSPIERIKTGTLLSERVQGESIAPKPQLPDVNVTSQKSSEQIATPVPTKVPEVRVVVQASGKASSEGMVTPKTMEQLGVRADIPSKSSVPPEVMVRLTAQIVERFPVRAEPPKVQQRVAVAQKRQEHFKSKVLDTKRIPAPALNDRTRELVAAVREVSLQRNIVRSKFGIEAKKELLKDSTSLLKRLRAEDRKESLIFKPLQELERLIVKYSPPLAVKTGVEKRMLEKLPDLRKAPEIMIKVFETVTAISTSAERLLSKLKDPSLEKLLPPETLSKLQGLIQELVRSSLPLGTDPEGLTPERMQSLKSKIEELIAKMREELLHLDLNSDDLSELIDILESLNELEALEELLLEELILLEEPSTFEEVLQEENVIILPEEPEEEIEEVFVVEGWVIDSVTELGISGVEVFGGLIGREITDSDGYFAFNNIPKNTFLTIGLDPDLGECEPEVFSVTVSHNEMVRFFVTR